MKYVLKYSFFKYSFFNTPFKILLGTIMFKHTPLFSNTAAGAELSEWSTAGSLEPGAGARAGGDGNSNVCVITA